MKYEEPTVGFRFRPKSQSLSCDSAASSENDTASARAERNPDPVALYAEFAPLVNQLINQYGAACPQLRDDLVGEIFCRFCAVYDAYDPARGIPLRPYMVHQLRASVYTYVRSYRRPASRELPIEPYADQVRPELHDNPTHDWNHKLFMESAREVVHRSLVKLSERQKQVVTQRYYHDESFDTIARDLGVQAVTARSLLRHALTNLRVSLQAEQLLLD